MAMHRRPFLATPFAGLLAAHPAGAQSGVIAGSATYRERIALPPGAVLHVALLALARPEAPAQTIAEATIPVPGQVPVAFSLAYDPARLDQARAHALRAEILVDGQAMFRTDPPHPLPAGGAAERLALLLVRVRAAAATDPVPALVGPRWVAEAIGGVAVSDGPRPDITFTAEGEVHGTGGCNRFAGRYTQAGAALRFAPLGTTMMACGPAAGDREQRFHAALAAVRGWRIEAGLLHLTDPGGATLVRLAAGG